MIRVLFSLLFLAMVTGCVSSTEIPVDHYYRLPSVPASAVDNAAFPATTLYVRPLAARGLLKSQNLLYSFEEKPFEVKKYFYHLWVDKPARLVSDNLNAYLASSKLFKAVTPYNFQPDATLQLTTELKQMEIRYAGTKTFLLIEISASLVSQDEGMLLQKTFRTRQPVTNRDIYTIVESYRQGFESVFGQLAEAIGNLKSGQ